MWTCPACGRKFTRKNQSHSCEQYDLDAFFIGKTENARKLFDTLLERVQPFGEVDLHVGKYHLTLRHLSTFSSIMVEKDHLTIVFISQEPIDEFPVHKNHPSGPNKYANVIKVEEVDEIDNQLIRWLQEAYEMAI